MKIDNLEVYGIIYKIVNIINGKVYIGQTTEKRGFDGRYHYKGKDIERVHHHYKNLKNQNRNHNEHLLYSIEKYGFESFEVNKTFDVAFSQEELNIKEKTWIGIYKATNDRFGYNTAEGGNYGKLSEKTKEKIRQKAIGRKLSEETKIKISLNSGKSFLGKHHSEESKQKMSKSSKGKNAGENHYLYGKHVNNREVLGKSVVCLNTNEVFECLIDAKIKYNCNHISECCNNNKLFSGISNGERLAWRYYEDYIGLSQEEINNIVHYAQIVKNSNEERQRKVFCLNSKKIFNSVKEASKYYEIHTGSIIFCCQGKCKTGGKDKYTGEKLIWKYLEDVKEGELINE